MGKTWDAGDRVKWIVRDDAGDPHLLIGTVRLGTGEAGNKLGHVVVAVDEPKGTEFPYRDVESESLEELDAGIDPVVQRKVMERMSKVTVPTPVHLHPPATPAPVTWAEAFKEALPSGEAVFFIGLFVVIPLFLIWMEHRK